MTLDRDAEERARPASERSPVCGQEADVCQVSRVDPHRLRPPDLADDMVFDSERPPYDSPNQHVLPLALYTQILRTNLY